jgi:hypothetical protein
VLELEAVKRAPFPRLRISTGAFAMTAPVPSEIVPVTVDKAVWPKARDADSSRDAARSESRFIIVFLR